MSGFGVLVRKELLEAWRTRRLPVVGGLFLVIGMVSPLTARYLPEILEAALGSELTVPIPEPTVATAVDQLLKNLGQMGALSAIALAMGSVAGELDRGTAALILAQPATRGAFLGAKLAALGVVIAVSTAVAVAAGWVYTAVLFEPPPVGGWVALAALSTLALAAWAAVTFLASVVTGSTSAAAGIGFLALIGLSVLAAIPALDRVLPTGLVVPSIQLATGDTAALDAGVLATAIAGTLALIAGCTAVAVAAFRRREL